MCVCTYVQVQGSLHTLYSCSPRNPHFRVILATWNILSAYLVASGAQTRPMPQVLHPEHYQGVAPGRESRLRGGWPAVARWIALLVTGSEESSRRCSVRWLHLEARKTCVALATQLGQLMGQDKGLQLARDGLSRIEHYHQPLCANMHPAHSTTLVYIHTYIHSADCSVMPQLTTRLLSS